jgi:hypothetical protein
MYKEPQAANTEASTLDHCPMFAIGSVWKFKGLLKKFSSPLTIRARTIPPN